MKRSIPIISGILLIVLANAVMICSPQATFAATGQSEASASSAPYVLRVDDQLDINVAGHDDLKASVTVLSDGTITLPGAGTIRAQGMTISALTGMLTTRYGRTINQPEVTVGVRSAPLPVGRVSVLGAVRTPGQFTSRPNFRVLDVIAAAGGLAQDVSSSKATIIRDGGGQSIPVDLAALYSSPSSTSNLEILDGDVILVDNVAAQLFQVQVTGEVARPGSYPVSKAGTTVFDLLLQAGGPTKAASLKDAQILHNGAVQVIDLRGYGTNLTDKVNTVRILPGDVLQIPQIIDRYAMMGAVRSPNVYNLPDGKPVSLRSALVTAGGTDSDADVKHATLLRTDATGKTTTTPVDLARLLSGADPDTQIDSGDILYVPTAKAKQPFNPMQLLSLVPIIGLLRR